MQEHRTKRQGPKPTYYVTTRNDAHKHGSERRLAKREWRAYMVTSRDTEGLSTTEDERARQRDSWLESAHLNFAEWCLRQGQPVPACLSIGRHTRSVCVSLCPSLSSASGVALCVGRFCVRLLRVGLVERARGQMKTHKATGRPCCIMFGSLFSKTKNQRSTSPL